MGNTTVAVITELTGFGTGQAAEAAAKRAAGELAGDVAGPLAGLVVQPVVWHATGTNPNAGDITTWLGGAGVGLLGLSAAPFAMIPGITKGVVDDRVAGELEEVRGSEPSHVRAGIDWVGNYGFWASGNGTQAAQIAMDGGTAWRHPNGLWVYLRDGNGLLVADYKPASSTTCYRPRLSQGLDGRGRFSTYTL